MLNMKVADLIDSSRNWRESLIEVLFPNQIAHKILTIYIPQPGGEDHMIWEFEKSGAHSVRLSFGPYYSSKPECVIILII
ncbi:unnamed protein product [Coffea canephora]|uniref:Uncharacterized protein n=1 Tax=Coffea canephora TaxID=49390 RepID=A0A068V1J2_COFCA|nr:unnamed protein product [Coffea canephora]